MLLSKHFTFIIYKSSNFIAVRRHCQILYTALFIYIVYVFAQFKNFTLFVESLGYAGDIEELQIPNLSLKTEEFRAGGMDAPMEIDMGMEKLELTATLTAIDEEALKLFGKTAAGGTSRGAIGEVAKQDYSGSYGYVME